MTLPEPGEPAPEPAPVRRPAPPQDQACELCRRCLPLTFHHLIPRRMHRRREVQRRFTPARCRFSGLWVCRPCHDAVHARHDERRLALELNTREALLAEPGLARYLAWARRQRVADTA